MTLAPEVSEKIVPAKKINPNQLNKQNNRIKIQILKIKKIISIILTLNSMDY
jgi:hypothetical protein